MGEVSASDVVPTPQYVLKYILHVTEVTGRDTFATDFIERLPDRSNILLDSGVAVLGEHPGNVTGVGNTEPIFPFLSSHLPWIIAEPIR